MRLDADPPARLGGAEDGCGAISKPKPLQVRKIVVAIGYLSTVTDPGGRIDAEYISLAAPYVRYETLAPVGGRETGGAAQFRRIARPSGLVLHVDSPIDFAKRLTWPNSF